MKRLSHILIPLFLMSAGSLPAEEISTQTIAGTWKAHGNGVVRYQNRMLFMQEAEETSGVMVVSPEAFPADVTLRYEIMPLNAASVCVAMLSASDNGDGKSLTLPEDYDGSMGIWVREIDNYFFAFHNMAHDRTPFLVRFPETGQLAEHETNVMRNGGFHTIEVGRKGGKIWMSVNGQMLFEAEEDAPLGPGHIAFRIRGINGQTAACLIRNVSIITD
jgi:hypothetical protein